MNKEANTDFDPAEFGRNLQKSHQLVQKVLETIFLHSGNFDIKSTNESLGFSKTISMFGRAMMEHPEYAVNAGLQWCQDQASLWRHFWRTPNEPFTKTQKWDGRFKDPAWNKADIFDLLKQSYLLTSNWMQDTVEQLPGLEAKTSQRMTFFTRQISDAMSPTNFTPTNPQVINEIIASSGSSLVRGLENFLDDIDRSKGALKIKTVEPNAFKVGESVASTPGEIIYRNDLMELIQYSPETATVHKRPLLIIPPWINKFYILDLQPKNSFVKWCVGKGYTVFMISWVNPDRSHSKKEFSDYMRQGPLSALDTIERATGESAVAAVSLCLGGTLLATTLGYCAAVGDTRIKSATLIATQVDFSEPGQLGVFIEDQQITALEKRMSKHGGILDAEAMASAFNMLRANELIWSFVVNNYLLGRSPQSFDLLYWNADGTRMPSRMHTFYLRNMYLQNKLSQPNALEMLGERINLSKVTIPIYLVGNKEDHIAPWKSVYKGTHLFGGPVKFVLAGSGHVAGVTNAPPNAKYGHWTNDDYQKSPENWEMNATEHKESWWVDWSDWQCNNAGNKITVRWPGDGQLKTIEPAPGSYVRQMS